MKTQKKRKLVFWGGFGGFNLGDEAIISAQLIELQKILGSDSSYALIVPRDAYENAKQIYRKRDLLIIRETLCGITAFAFNGYELVVGGGELIDDKYTFFPVIRTLRLLLIFKMFGRKSYLFAVGISSLKRRLHRVLIRVFYRLFTHITVRDPNSLERSRELIGGNIPMYNIWDSTINLWVATSFKKRPRVASLVWGMDPRRHRSQLEEIYPLLTKLSDSGYSFDLLQHDKRYDLQDPEKFLPPLNSCWRSVSKSNIEDLLDYYEGVQLVISNRLHPLLLGLFRGCHPVCAGDSSKLAILEHYCQDVQFLNAADSNTCFDKLELPLQPTGLEKLQKDREEIVRMIFLGENNLAREVDPAEARVRS